ncbi:MAG: CHAT domain-containing tetratricopeptide repeat protein [Bacteroidota bacterium]
MPTIRNILCLSVLFFGGWCYGQSVLAKKYDSIISSELNSAEKIKAVEELFSNEKEEHQELADLYYQFSKWNWIRAKDQRRAKLYAKKEYALRTSSDSLQPNLIQRNLYNLGYLHHHSSYPDYDNAIAYFDTLISVSNGDELRLANVYRERGDIFDALGDFQRAFENYTYSENISKDGLRPDLQLKALINVSGTLVNLSDSTYLDAFIANQKKIVALTGIEVSPRQQALLQFNSGAIFNTTPQFVKAFVPTQEALEYFESVNDSVNIVKCLNLLGVLHTKNLEYAEATRVLSSAREFARGNRLLQSSVANNLGDVLQNSGNYQTALEQYHLAVNITLGKTNNDSNLELPDFDELSISPFKKRIFGYLTDLANCWIASYQQTKKPTSLVRAERTIALADQVVDALFLESREALSKLSWREKASQLYQQGVMVAYERDQPEDALYYMEKNKGLLLLENITNVRARQQAGIPVTAIDREYLLLSTIKELQFELAAIDPVGTGNSALDHLKARIFEVKTEYEKFIDSLETTYPSYVKFKRQLEIRSLDQIQADLRPGERVVSYALGDEQGYVLLLTRDNIVHKKLPVSMSILNREVQKFRAFLERPFATRSDATNFQSLAKQLYDWLFPFDHFGMELDNTPLVVIPDGSLQTIPFGVLTVSSELPLSEAYLIRRAPIAYKYSLSIGSGIDRLLPEENRGTAGFVLSEFSNNYENTLSSGAKEFDAIEPFFKDQIFTDNRATKKEFLKQFDQGSLLHISTHGGVGKDGPWLAFYDERLRLEELYFLKNQKELVVLSACKTSVGEHRKGEGVFSITRGFLNAGVKSVLSTLWDINERSSFEVVSAFYEELESGEGKSEALRQAKLTYLEGHDNTSEASPYYWSGITITGDDEPIRSSIGGSFYLMGLLALGVVLGGVLVFAQQTRGSARGGNGG